MNLSRGMSRVLNKCGNIMVNAALCMYQPQQTQQTQQKREAISWYQCNGDKTLRLDYDLNKDSLVFDIGGYEGQWASDIFSKYCCRIHVFEPVPEFSKKLENRFYRNDWIIVHNFGLSRESHRVKMTVDRDKSSMHKGGEHDTDSSVVKASEFIMEHGIKKIDLMKINIEGEEYNLLEHLIETGVIKIIQNVQVQFHDFVEHAEERMKHIQGQLARTHELTYQFPFVWENWRAH